MDHLSPEEAAKAPVLQEEEAAGVVVEEVGEVVAAMLAAVVVVVRVHQHLHVTLCPLREKLLLRLPSKGLRKGLGTGSESGEWVVSF